MSTLTDLIDRNPRFLRRAILADAAASGATGLMMIAGAGLLEGLLGLPAALLRGAGIVLLPYVAFVAWVGTRDEIAHAAVWTIIAANALWVAASVLLLVSGWVAPTALGYAFVIAQAAVVALLGELQYTGLRRWQRPEPNPRGIGSGAHLAPGPLFQ